MSKNNSKKIVRLLGVGFDTDDGHVRITNAENYDVIMGSDESHEYLQGFIKQIEDEVKRRGLVLDDLTPDDLTELIESIKR